MQICAKTLIFVLDFNYFITQQLKLYILLDKGTTLLIPAISKLRKKNISVPLKEISTDKDAFNCCSLASRLETCSKVMTFMMLTIVKSGILKTELAEKNRTEHKRMHKQRHPGYQTSVPRSLGPF